MTVYSYTSGRTLIIADVADFPISAYADIPISTFAKEINQFHTVGKLLENISYSYNESSFVNTVDFDYGSISESALDSEDYGFITNISLDNESYGILGDNKSIFPYGSIQIEGVGKENYTRSPYKGSGILFGFNSAAEVFGSNPPETPQLFKITGSAFENDTKSYIGSGSLFKFSNKVEKRTYVYNESAYVGTFGEDYGLITNSITDQDDYGFLSGDPYYPWQQEDYGFLQPDGSLIPYGKVKISGYASESFSTPEISVGRASITGQSIVVVVPKHVGKGFARIIGEGDFKQSSNWNGSGSLFKFSNKVEKRTYVYNESAYVGTFGEDYEFINQSPVFEDDYGFLSGDPYYPWQQEDYGFLEPDGSLIPYGRLKFSGRAVERFSTPEIASGTIVISGEVIVVPTPKEFGKGVLKIGNKATTIFALGHIGSGSVQISNVIDKNLNPEIRFYNEFESVGWNPPETPQLFKFTGSAIQKNTESYVGSGRIFLGEKTGPIFRLKHIGSGSVKLSGEGEESYIRTPFIGSGSLFTFNSASEILGSNPPESTELFKITGSAIQKNTESYVGSGTLNIDSSGNTIFRLKHIGFGSIGINGSAKESTTPGPHVGSGSLFAFNSAVEVSGSNPPESTQLFKITGSAIEKNVEIHTGSGSLFALNSATQVSGSNPPESTQLFKVTGTLLESVSPAPYIGSGSLFNLFGSSESATFNPSESTQLFKITGSAVAKEIDVHAGSGLVDLNGRASTIFRLKHIGSGSIFTFVDAAEVSGSNPPETPQLFKITGSALEKNVDSYIGSGSLFTFLKSAESKTKFTSTSGLFKITGSAVEKNTEAFSGSGRLFEFGRSTQTLTYFASTTGLFKITGSAIQKNTESYLGSGSIFTFVSAAEVSGSNPPETPQLFKITGSATEKNTEVFHGSGRLFEFSSAVESTTKFVSTTGLFKISGLAQVKVLNRQIGNGSTNLNGTIEESSTQIHVGSGSLFTFISKTESKLSNVESVGVIKVSGTSDSKFTRSESGVGKLNVNGSAVTVFKLKTIASGLFDIGGTVKESFSPAGHNGSGSLAVFVNKEESVTFVPVTKGTVFTFVGTAPERNTEAYNGTGSIDTLSGSAEVFAAIYNVTRVLFTIGGSLSEAFVQGSFKEEGNIIIRGSVKDSKYVEYEPPTPTRIYII